MIEKTKTLFSSDAIGLMNLLGLLSSTLMPH